MQRVLAFVTLISLILATSCKEENKTVQGPPGKAGSSCSVYQKENGALIQCEDGTFSYIYHGLAGVDGIVGLSCSAHSTENGAEVICQDGTYANIYNGSDGTYCIVEEVIDGALVTCGDSTAVIYNGTNGTDGEDFDLSTQEVISFIDPCGDKLNSYDEVIIETFDGSLIAYFEDGGKRFLTLLSPGDYITTDEQKCKFTITEDFEIIW